MSNLTMCPDNLVDNANRLRVIAKINPGSRINVDKKWALEIAEQLERSGIFARMIVNEFQNEFQEVRNAMEREKNVPGFSQMQPQ